MKPRHSLALLLLLSTMSIAQSQTTHTRIAIKLEDADSYSYVDAASLKPLLLAYSNDALPIVLKEKFGVVQDKNAFVKLSGGSGSGEIVIAIENAKFQQDPEAVGEAVRLDFEKYLLEKLLKSAEAEAADAGEKLRDLEAKTVDSDVQIKKLEAAWRDAIDGPYYVGNLDADISALRKTIEDLKVDSAGKTARAMACEEAIANLTDRMRAQAESDQVVQELQKLLDMQEKRLGELSKNSAISQKEMVTTLAEMRVRLLERKAAAVASGSGTINQLNHDLIQLSIDRREIEARMEVLSRRLQKLTRSIEITSQISALTQAKQQADSAKVIYREATDAVDRIKKAPPRAIKVDARN